MPRIRRKFGWSHLLAKLVTHSDEMFSVPALLECMAVPFLAASCIVMGRSPS